MKKRPQIKGYNETKRTKGIHIDIATYSRDPNDTIFLSIWRETTDAEPTLNLVILCTYK